MAYSTMRAAAVKMIRCAALTASPKGVCVNAVSTNFMNYPGFKKTTGVDVSSDSGRPYVRSIKTMDSP